MTTKLEQRTAAALILEIAYDNIDNARSEFHLRFGQSYVDPSFNVEFYELITRHLSRGTRIELSLELALAYLLRLDWRKGGNRKDSAVARGARQYLYQYAEWCRKRLLEENRSKPRTKRMSRGKIREMAARRAIQLYGTQRIRVSVGTVVERVWNKQATPFPPLTEDQLIELDQSLNSRKTALF